MSAQTRPSPAHLPVADKLTEIPETAIEAAGKLSKLTDRGWLALLMLVGLVVLGVMGMWHRQDQKAMTELYNATIKANTEALLRCALVMERLERK